jgi:enoyl-CoA hydratase/carnithine racemase
VIGPIEFEQYDGVDGPLALIRLHRPEVRNALDVSLLGELVDAFDRLGRRDDIRGLVLTGADGAFSAGADLAERSNPDRRRWTELFTLAQELLVDLPMPTVAAIEGAAIGGGAELAGGCDVRIAGRSALLRFPGAVHGVPVGVARTIGQVGLSVAKEWVLSGRPIPAEEAERRGFVQRLVEDGEAVDTAIAWLTVVAERDAPTIALLGRLFDQQSGLRDRVAFENDLLRVQAESGQLPSLTADLPRTVRPRRHEAGH